MTKQQCERQLELWRRKAERIEWLIHRAGKTAEQAQDSRGEAYFGGKADGLDLAWKILNGDVNILYDPFEDILGPE